jgi:plasmid stabilization system protein ParE
VEKIKLTKRAILDVALVKRYSQKKWGSRVAEEYVASIEKALQLISSNHSLLRQKSEIPGRLRFYTVRQHVLVGVFVSGVPYILTIKHCAMDLPTRLRELEPGLQVEVEYCHKSCEAARRMGKRKR